MAKNRKRLRRAIADSDDGLDDDEDSRMTDLRSGLDSSADEAEEAEDYPAN